MRQTPERLTRTARIGLGGVLALVMGLAVPGSGSADPAPALEPGANQQINTGDDLTICNAQAEVHLATTGSTIVAGWIDDQECEAGAMSLLAGPQDEPVPWSTSAWGYSEDGGETWMDGGLLDPGDGQLRGDPVLAAGDDGIVHYASRGLHPERILDQRGQERTVGRSVIYVMTSTDHGRTFGPPVDASPGLRIDAEQDKPWMAVDRSAGSAHRGTLHVAWTEYLETPLELPPTVDDLTQAQPHERRVLYSRSLDGGATFSEPRMLSLPMLLEAGAPEDSAGVGAQVAVGPDGEVYVVWTAYELDSSSSQVRAWSSRLWFSRSLDGGETFSPPQIVAEPTGIGHIGASCIPPEPGHVPVFDYLFARDYTLVLNGGIKVRNWPSMAVDHAGSPNPTHADFNPNHGRIYIALAQADQPSDTVVQLPVEDEADIYLLYSDTRGVTWEGVDRDLRPGQIVNDDLTQNTTVRTDQFHPMVTVDEEGVAAIAWYDRRRSTANAALDVYMATTTDGRTFSPNVRVNDTDAGFLPPQHHNPFTTPVPDPRDVADDPDPEADAGPEQQRPPIRGGWAGGCNGLGEYNGIVATGPGEFLVAWGDNRDAVAGVSDINIYTSRVRTVP